MLAAAPSAEGKLCVRVSAPRTASSGQPILVSVTTLLPAWSDGKLAGVRPVPAFGPALRLDAVGPGGEWRRLRLTRTKRPAIWSVRVSLDARGVWTLEAAGWGTAPRGCAAPARVLVR